MTMRGPRAAAAALLAALAAPGPGAAFPGDGPGRLRGGGPPGAAARQAFVDRGAQSMKAIVGSAFARQAPPGGGLATPSGGGVSLVTVLLGAVLVLLVLYLSFRLWYLTRTDGEVPTEESALLDKGPGLTESRVRENAHTMFYGHVYEWACCCCAGLGISSNIITVPQGSVGVVTEFGKYSRTLAPGRHKFNVMSEKVQIVDMKLCCMNVPQQDVMTQDNLGVRLDAVCYFKVLDAQKAVFTVDDYTTALRNFAQVTLRTVLGESSLSQVLAERQRNNARLQELMDEVSESWGVKVERVELSKIEIDESMQRAMAAKAEADQEAEAKLIQARAQRECATVLAEAAEKMSKDPMAIKLQWFETLRIVSTQGKNTTIIVPDSMESSTALAAKAAAGPMLKT